jgi:hypothetical protein
MSNQNDFVIPGRDEVASPESIPTGALGPWAIRAKQRTAERAEPYCRECGKPHARCGYGFRARRLRVAPE